MLYCSMRKTWHGVKYILYGKQKPSLLMVSFDVFIYHEEMARVYTSCILCDSSVCFTCSEALQFVMTADIYFHSEIQHEKLVLPGIERESVCVCVCVFEEKEKQKRGPDVKDGVQCLYGAWVENTCGGV